MQRLLEGPLAHLHHLDQVEQWLLELRLPVEEYAALLQLPQRELSFTRRELQYQ